MPFYIKLRDKRGAIVEPPMRFSSVGLALEFAGALLPMEPADIWLEDERGVRVSDMQTIAKKPKMKGRDSKPRN